MKVMFDQFRKNCLNQNAWLAEWVGKIWTLHDTWEWGVLGTHAAVIRKSRKLAEILNCETVLGNLTFFLRIVLLNTFSYWGNQVIAQTRDAKNEGEPIFLIHGGNGKVKNIRILICLLPKSATKYL